MFGRKVSIILTLTLTIALASLTLQLTLQASSDYTLTQLPIWPGRMAASLGYTPSYLAVDKDFIVTISGNIIYVHSWNGKLISTITETGNVECLNARAGRIAYIVSDTLKVVTPTCKLLWTYRSVDKYLCIEPDTRTIYSRSGNNLLAFDLDSGTLLATLNFPATPDSIQSSGSLTALRTSDGKIHLLSKGLLITSRSDVTHYSIFLSQSMGMLLAGTGYPPRLLMYDLSLNLKREITSPFSSWPSSYISRIFANQDYALVWSYRMPFVLLYWDGNYILNPSIPAAGGIGGPFDIYLLQPKGLLYYSSILMKGGYIITLPSRSHSDGHRIAYVLGQTLYLSKLPHTAPVPEGGVKLTFSQSEAYLRTGGSTKSITLAVDPAGAREVTLELVSVPTGLTATLSPTSGIAPFTATLTLNPVSILAGSYSVNVIARNENGTPIGAATLKVTVSNTPTLVRKQTWIALSDRKVEKTVYSTVPSIIDSGGQPSYRSPFPVEIG